MPGTPGQGSSTSRYLEVERKFDIDDSAVSPSFAGLAAVTRVEKLPAQSLDAVYFDTPARDLASKKITLRRRTGGSDPGWHLKVPAGPDARTELRAPLAAAHSDTVPSDLRDVVLAIVRDRPLAPVARISTTRGIQLLHGTDGAVLAEFCDDHVIASTTLEATEQRWREWEVELVEADPTADPGLLDRLSDRLLSTGAAPAGHGSKLARVLGPAPNPGRATEPVHRAVAGQVDELLVRDRAVRADADDAVHQMRVTTRKIRSLLQASADTFGLTGPSSDDWVLHELRWLAGVLGVARDAEVLAQRYRQALDRLPPELVRGRVRQRLVAGAVRRYRAGRRRSLIAMRSPRYFRLLDGLETLVAEPLVGDQATGTATIDAAYRRVRKAAKAAARAGGDSGRDEALHRIRKRAKRLRYTAAATDAPKVAKRAKAIQTLLGDHQDSVVSRAHLIQQADAAHAAGEDTFSYGLLYQQEDDLARNCRARLDRALRKLAKAVRKLR